MFDWTLRGFLKELLTADAGHRFVYPAPRSYDPAAPRWSADVIPVEEMPAKGSDGRALLCPRCQRQLIEARFVSAQINVDGVRCKKCTVFIAKLDDLGVDPTRFWGQVEVTSRTGDLQEARSYRSSPGRVAEHGACPFCLEMLSRVNLLDAESTEIEACPQCHAAVFDFGEVAAATQRSL